MKFEEILPKLREGRVCVRTIHAYPVQYRFNKDKLESCQGGIWAESMDPCQKFIIGDWTVERELVTFTQAFEAAQSGKAIRPVWQTLEASWAVWEKDNLLYKDVGSLAFYTGKEILGRWEIE